jgi:hypothetical protein
MSDVNNASKPPGSSDNSSMIPLALSTISIVAVGGGIYYLQNEISENEKKLKKLEELLVSTVMKVKGLQTAEIATLKLGEAFQEMRDQVESIKNGETNLLLGLRSVDQKLGAMEHKLGTMVNVINHQQNMLIEVQEVLKKEGHQFEYILEKNPNTIPMKMPPKNGYSEMQPKMKQPHNFHQNPKISPNGMTNGHGLPHNNPSFGNVPPKNFQAQIPKTPVITKTSSPKTTHSIVGYQGDISGMTNRMLSELKHDEPTRETRIESATPDASLFF